MFEGMEDEVGEEVILLSYRARFLVLAQTLIRAELAGRTCYPAYQSAEVVKPHAHLPVEA